MSEKKLKVCIIGGGAAGIASAWSLSRFPDKYDVQLWEKHKRAGGQATSETVNAVNSYINDGVQGGPGSFRNVFGLHRQFGFNPTPAEMRVSFGKGENNWTNYSETPLVKRLKGEIRRFGTVLKIIKTFEIFFTFLPIYRVLRLFMFSDDFINLMVLPLVALFFGTGNQTPHVSSAVVCRVFLDPDLRLFNYDPDKMLSEQPTMYAFPKLGEIYEVLSKSIKGKVFLNRPVAIVKRDPEGISVTDTEGKTEVFDRLIFACDPETILKITKDLTWLERKLLGNVEYFDDVTVTHTDEEYMHKHYDIDMKNKDLYLIKTDPKDTRKLDMSFNLTFYQPQLTDKRPYVFQTIFLNKENQDKWTMDEIKKDKIQLVKWWRQMSHGWKHFATWVPYQMLIQGTKNTFYTGSYTLVNTHEIATISGLAAAARLGAPYPFEDDALAKKVFDGYSLVVHGRVFTKGKMANLVTILKLVLALVSLLIVFQVFKILI